MPYLPDVVFKAYILDITFMTYISFITYITFILFILYNLLIVVVAYITHVKDIDCYICKNSKSIKAADVDPKFNIKSSYSFTNKIQLFTTQTK